MDRTATSKRPSRVDSIAGRVLVSLAAGYALLALYLLWEYRFTSVHLDFWVLYGNLFRLPFPANILTPYNSHCLAVPAAIWAANLWATGGNETALYLVMLFFVSLTIWLLLRSISFDPRISRAARRLLIVSVLLMSFWPARMQILMSGGFGLHCILPIVGLLVAVRSLFAHPANTGAAATQVVAGCALATFSYGTGAAVWPTMLVLGWLRRMNWRFFAAVGAGSVVAAISLILFRCWFDPTRTQHALVQWSADTIWYFIEVTGAPWAYTYAGLTRYDGANHLVAQICGVIGLCLGGFGLWSAHQRRDDLTMPEWIGAALVVFSTVAAGLIAIGRGRFFHHVPFDVFSSRFVFSSAYFWIGLIWLLFRAPLLRWKPGDTMLTAAAFSGLLLVWPGHLRAERKYQDERDENTVFVTALASGYCPRKPFMWFIQPSVIGALDRTAREKRLLYYSENFYHSVGQQLKRVATLHDDSDAAQILTRRKFASAFDGREAYEVTGTLRRGTADLVVVTNKENIICGLGCFIGSSRPFWRARRERFVAFAPATAEDNACTYWAIRGKAATQLRFVE